MVPKFKVGDRVCAYIRDRGSLKLLEYNGSAEFIVSDVRIYDYISVVAYRLQYMNKNGEMRDVVNYLFPEGNLRFYNDNKLNPNTLAEFYEEVW